MQAQVQFLVSGIYMPHAATMTQSSQINKDFKKESVGTDSSSHLTLAGSEKHWGASFEPQRIWATIPSFQHFAGESEHEHFLPCVTLGRKLLVFQWLPALWSKVRFSVSNTRRCSIWTSKCCYALTVLMKHFIVCCQHHLDRPFWLR